MKYIIKFNDYKITENKNWSPLLDLENNVDYELVDLIEKLIPIGSNILEISCGNGSDSFELLDRGYNVTATEYNKDYCDFVNKRLTCINHNTINKFPFDDKSFDLVYSRLGLHYFTNKKLTVIFDDISRIVTDYLVFTVKLNQDDILTNKVIITKEKWENLTSKNFKIVSSKVKSGILYDNQSKWLEIVAWKKDLNFS